MSGVPGEMRTAQQRQMERAAQRFQETEKARTDFRELQARTGLAVHDTFEQVRARTERLIELKEAPVEAILDVALATTPDRQAVYERIIGASTDLQSVSFLPRGVRAAAPVARIVLLSGGREIPYGTGFLVSPELLLTNHHVIGDPDLALRVVVEFAAEVDIDHRPRPTVRHRLDPAAFFAADEELDFALVRVLPGEGGQPPGALFGWNPLLRTQGKIVSGEPVNIVGHPMGRLKEIAIRANELVLQTDDFLQYSTDTERGNSGSPVFNDQWEVVALHHSAVPEVDAEGRWLRTDGTPVRPGDPDSLVAWASNEGTRVSSILESLTTREFTPGERELLAGLGPAAMVVPGPPVPAAEPFWRRERPRAPRYTGVAGSDGDGVHLVFVHGRGQQNLAPDRLRAGWAAGLNTGLAAAGLPRVRPETVWFPYYGDLLVEETGTEESLRAGPRGTAESLAPAGDEPRAVYESMLAEAALRTGMPTELVDGEPALSTEEGLGVFSSALVGRLQRQLSWVAARSGLDEMVIALFLRDVAGYLGDAPVREAILDAVAGCLPASGDTVVVGHSLGSVVALDLLTRDRPDVTVTLLVTAGSPLGLDAVHDRVLHQPPGRPDRVGAWLNAWSPADAVSIGCPLSPVWGPGLSEIVTDNSPRDPHDITEYLRHPEVARRVAGALRPNG